MLRIALYIFLLLIAFDAIWLYIRSDYHARFFANVQKSPIVVRWIPAILVYSILAGALSTTILHARSPRDAALRGALAGAAFYGFYDATNLATLTGWTWEMAIIDTLWGAFACSAVSYIIYMYK